MLEWMITYYVIKIIILITSFLQSQGFTHPVLLDSERQLYTRYVVPGLPTTFFIDKEGLIQDGVLGAFESTEEIESILNQLKW